MKTRLRYAIPLLCLLLSTACQSDIPELLELDSSFIETRSENDIQIIGNFMTGSEHSITYTPNPAYNEYISIQVTETDSYRIISNGSSMSPIKVVFFKPGTFKIVVRSRQRYNAPIVSERVINIEGNDIVRLYAYTQLFYFTPPLDYWYTTINYGLNYNFNGSRVSVESLTGSPSGSLIVGYNPTLFYAISPNLNANDGPALTPIYESSQQVYNAPQGNLTLYSYSLDVGYSSSTPKLYVYSEQQPGTVPLYLIRRRFTKTYPSPEYHSDTKAIAHFTYLSTVNTSTQVCWGGDELHIDIFPGTVVGYVYPASRR